MEDGVSALAAEDAGCARRLGAARHVCIIGHIQPVQAGSQGLAEAHQLFDRDGGDGLPRILQGYAQRFSRFSGPGALIALAPGAMVVDEGGVFRSAGGDQGRGDYGGIEPAGQLCDQMAMA